MGLLTAFSYPVLIIGTIIAQPAAALGSGALAAGGLINFWLAFWIIFVTDLIMDTVWYGLGRVYGEGAARFLKKVFRVNEEMVVKVQTLFHTRPILILLSAKLLGGFGMMPFILFTAGSSRMRYDKYIFLNAAGEVLWTGGQMVLGFFFSSIIGSIEDTIGKMTALAGAIIVLGLYFYAFRMGTKKVLNRPL